MIKQHLTTIILIGLLFFQACNSSDKKPESIQLEAGSWLMKMQLKGAILPFNFDLSKETESYVIKITNADEEIYIDGVTVYKDSIEFNMPVFESAFYLKIHSPDSISGTWVNYYKSNDYTIDVWAVRTEQSRFSELSEKEIASDLLSKYEVEFSPNEEDAYKAIGLFEANGGRVKGTFATETGDYRYLEGGVVGDSLYLSTFDGSHAFYFSAVIKDSSLEGVFISGIHHKEKWIAQYNPDFELRNPDSLTSLTDSSAIHFSLPNIDGERVSLNDSIFKNKVKLIQIMGSWCPNCLDESRYFNQLNDKYADEGLEIIAIAFERTRNEERAIQNIKNLITKEHISYPVLVGGYSRDQHPMDIFPMLDKIVSYPTTLFLDKDNMVRRIHTGFYGPGTGEYYEEYKSETESLISSLLKEN